MNQYNGNNCQKGKRRMHPFVGWHSAGQPVILPVAKTPAGSFKNVNNSSPTSNPFWRKFTTMILWLEKSAQHYERI